MGEMSVKGGGPSWNDFMGRRAMGLSLLGFGLIVALEPKVGTYVVFVYLGVLAVGGLIVRRHSLPTFVVCDGYLMGAGMGESWRIELADVVKVEWVPYRRYLRPVQAMCIQVTSGHTPIVTFLSTAYGKQSAMLNRIGSWRKVANFFQGLGIPVSEPGSWMDRPL